MRELEFLPDWYRTLHRRKRMVMLQGWLTTAIIIALIMRVVLVGRNVHADAESLTTLRGQLDQSNDQLQKVKEFEKLEDQLRQQAKIVSRLGAHVPTARLINALTEVMPREMGLLDLSMDTQVQQKAESGLAAASAADAPVIRKLAVRMRGVAPTDVELGNFLRHLSAVPYFGSINMSYSKDRLEKGHLMREFEVTFVIELTDDR